MATNTHSNKQQHDSTPDAKTLQGELGQTWYTFEQIARVAADEAKRYSDGKPSAETTLLLDALSDRLSQLEAQFGVSDVTPGSLVPSESTGELILNGQRYTYQKGTAEQARFVKALRGGLASLPEWSRDKVRLADPQWVADHKAMVQSNDTTGGYLAAPEFAADILRALQETSPVRQVATVHLTGGTGEFLPIRADVPTAVRVRETETRATTAGDLNLKAAQIPTHEAMCFTAVSRQVLMDSKYPLEQELVNAARVAFATLEGTEFITGDGVGKFKGLNATTLPAGNIVTSTDASGHSVLDTDLAKLLFETVNAAYLPGARLLLNKKTLGKFRQLKATTGNSLLLPVIDVPGTLAGVPYTLMPDMDEVGAANRNVVYLMHPSGFTVAQRMEVTVLRVAELLAEQGKILYYIFLRSGAQATLPEAISKIVTA
jgi:HK97 family phage major capsid protein